MSTIPSRILILDFGSQFTQLIARRIREQKVYCEIYPCNASLKSIEAFNPSGIILSGGPFSVTDKGAPKLAKGSKNIFDLGLPILGICYGMQYIANHFGGSVVPAKTREYGRAYIRNGEKSLLMPWLQSIKKIQVWMSHGDEIGELPNGFFLTAESHNGSPAAMECQSRKIFAVQFHPEVVHTEKGKEIFKEFIFNICHCKPEWDMGSLIENEIKLIKEKVGKANVICGISGGVDSTVAATLVHQAIGKQLTCIFVDNGLLRKDESKQVMTEYQEKLGLNIKLADASKSFLSKLKKITDPEKKRKIIGKEFIEVFKKESKKIGKLKKNVKYLVQGTLYPDVIESLPPPRNIQGTKQKAGYSSTIKSHHNVGGLPKDLKFELIEPLRELFKDEVREMGKILGVPDSILSRHPFPGPGLAVRILGDIRKDRLEILREADAIFIEEIKKAGLYSEIWQAFAVFLPIQSVGVMGDGRTYESAIALRAVTSQDGMTADWYPFKPEFLAHVSNRITGQVRGINRVVYDISSKPPSTIEWE